MSQFLVICQAIGFCAMTFAFLCQMWIFARLSKRIEWVLKWMENSSGSLGDTDKATHNPLGCVRCETSSSTGNHSDQDSACGGSHLSRKPSEYPDVIKGGATR